MPPPETIESYQQVSADPVKNGFDEAQFKSDPMRYVKGYAWLAVKNLDVFAESFLLGCYGYFCPGLDATGYQPRALDNPYPSINVYGIEDRSLFQFYEHGLRALVDMGWIYDIPVLSLLADMAFPFWLLIVASAYLIYRKRWRLLAPLVLLFGLWGTLLLGPVALTRYVFPLIMAVPVIIGLVFIRERNKAPEESQEPVNMQIQEN